MLLAKSMFTGDTFSAAAIEYLGGWRIRRIGRENRRRGRRWGSEEMEAAMKIEGENRGCNEDRRRWTLLWLSSLAGYNLCYYFNQISYPSLTRFKNIQPNISGPPNMMIHQTRKNKSNSMQSLYPGKQTWERCFGFF